MKNTLALGAILLGLILVYSGYKGWTVADTVRFFTGQEQKDVAKTGDNPGDPGDLNLPDDATIPIPGYPQIPGIPLPDSIPNPFSDVIPGNPVPAQPQAPPYGGGTL